MLEPPDPRPPLYVPTSVVEHRHREVWVNWGLQDHLWPNMTMEVWKLRMMEPRRAPVLRPSVKLSVSAFIEELESSENRLMAFLGFIVGDRFEQHCIACSKNPIGPFAECIWVEWLAGGACMNCLWSAPSVPDHCSYCEILLLGNCMPRLHSLI